MWACHGQLRNNQNLQHLSRSLGKKCSSSWQWKIGENVLTDVNLMWNKPVTEYLLDIIKYCQNLHPRFYDWKEKKAIAHRLVAEFQFYYKTLTNSLHQLFQAKHGNEIEAPTRCLRIFFSLRNSSSIWNLSAEILNCRI